MRRGRGFGLAEMAVSSGLWALLAGLIVLIAVNGSRGLGESELASRLCLASAALDAELRAASRVLEPRRDRSAKRLVLLDAEGRAWAYETRGADLTALEVSPPASADSSSEARAPAVEHGPRRTVARGIDLVIFHVRSGSPTVVRYFLGASGHPLLSSSWVGERP